MSFPSVPLLEARQDSTPLLAAILSRATTRRRGPSFQVRETAARHLQQQRAEWGYSTPVVALDISWNLAFVASSVAVLLSSAQEKPNEPIRVWIGGYAAQCAVHVVLVWLEYARRMRGRRRRRGGDDMSLDSSSNLDSNGSEDEDEGVVGVGAFGISNRESVLKRLESVNTMVSFIWWMVGLFFVVHGSEMLMYSAPRLYWLAVVFLAFDVFFAVFCFVMACLVGLALCCCLPCIIAILYAIAGQEGATDAELNILPKYKFHISSNEDKASVGAAGRMILVETNSAYLANERILLPEDAECCICLTEYEDGVELHTLPCNHHFHVSCIVKWLKMNATCPLCKYDILKGNEQV